MLERRVLHSWKDLASYTGHGVRTLQRYEVHLGFPIHRPAGKQRSAVLAFADEIDAWLNRAPRRQQVEPVLIFPAQLAERQIRSRRQYLALAANAKRSHEKAEAALEACHQQAKTIAGMLQRMKDLQAARANNSAIKT